MRIETKMIMDEFKDLILDYVGRDNCAESALSFKIIPAHWNAPAVVSIDW